MTQPRKKPIIIDGVEHWECSKCKIPKRHDDFSPMGHTANGLASWCKQCCREYAKEKKRKSIEAARMRAIAAGDIVVPQKSIPDEDMVKKFTEQLKHAKSTADKRRIECRIWYWANRDRARELNSNWEKENRDRRREYHNNRDKAKVEARRILNYAVSSGRLAKPTHCDRCGRYIENPRHLQGHHDDYSKPLEVDWFCTRCHGRLDRIENMEQNNG